MARELARETFKKTIDALREKPLTWSDLKKELGFPDKTLSRALEYLEYWGLAKKDAEGYWQWFEEIRTYETEHDYILAIKHSKKLLSSLQGSILLALDDPGLLTGTQMGAKAQELSILKQMAERHLETGYPNLQNDITTYENLLDERKKLSQEIERLEPRLKEIDLLNNIRVFTSTKWAVQKKHRKDIEDLIRKLPSDKLETIKKVEDKKTELYLKIASGLQTLVLQVENGEPLQGVCKLCPKIKLAKSNNGHN